MQRFGWPRIIERFAIVFGIVPSQSHMQFLFSMSHFTPQMLQWRCSHSPSSIVLSARYSSPQMLSWTSSTHVCAIQPCVISSHLISTENKQNYGLRSPLPAPLQMQRHALRHACAVRPCASSSHLIEACVYGNVSEPKGRRPQGCAIL